MSESKGFSQFCPVSMATEVLCTRWTPLVIRELLCGSARFGDLRRGVPRMSPTLLSQRLKELEAAGVVRVDTGARGTPEYHLTEAGEELRPVIMALGNWGQRWVESSLSLRNLDPSLLMWDMRRWLRPEPLPPHRCTVQFQYRDLEAARRNWWLVIENGEVDLCLTDPGHEVDLLVNATLRAMTAVWMGIVRLKDEVGEGAIILDGNPGVARSMDRWLGLSPFADQTRRVV